jgi:ABC-2 type transport system ATP-binding protein
MPAHQALTVHAHLHDVSPDRVNDALDRWQLTSQADTRVRNLSNGQRARLDLARALLHEPRVVLLDEPATGLDADALTTLEHALDRLDPDLVLASAPRDPRIDTHRRIELADGRLTEAQP